MCLFFALSNFPPLGVESSRLYIFLIFVAAETRRSRDAFIKAFNFDYSSTFCEIWTFLTRCVLGKLAAAQGMAVKRR